MKIARKTYKIENPTIENLREFKDDVYWRIIDQRDDFLYTNELIESFPDYINWSEASRANTINFTIDFVKKYSDRWDWKALLSNPLIVQKEDLYYSAFKEKINGVKFIDRFSKVEKMAEEKGINMKETDLSELDKLWDEAKKVSKKD